MCMCVLLTYLVHPVHCCTSGDAVLPSLSVLRKIDCLTPRHIHASDVFTYSFLPVLLRSASLRFPSGLQSMACTARLCPSILAMCPIQRSLLLLMMFPISSCPVLFHISLFVIISLQEMCNILLRHLLCAASSFLPFATIIGQVSESYSSVLSTTASHSLILVLISLPLLFHIFSSLPNA